MTTKNHDPSDAAPQQGQNAVASPNPTIDDSKQRAADPAAVGVRSISPVESTTAAPMKSTAKPKTKPKRRS